MSPGSRRLTLVIILLLLLTLLLLFFSKCAKTPPPSTTAAIVSPPTSEKANAPAPAAAPAPESLSAATIEAPREVAAGARFRATWTGPNNPGDYLTIVGVSAAPGEYANYTETRSGNPLELTAPIEPGEWEVRYVAVRSKTVLGRAPLRVSPVTATLSVPEDVVLGKPVAIGWTGPNNAGDYITIVPQAAPDDAVGNYADAAKGSPSTIPAPVQPGAMEIRYVSGQGRKVLGRRALVVTIPETTLTAESEVVAGTKFFVTWVGPNNPADYITVVPKGTPDGQYRNYTDTARGSPLELTAPIEPGEAELRYMTGSQARVLARRAIRVAAAKVELSAPERAVAGADVVIAWSGPKNAGDYLTIVPQTFPDGRYGNYAEVSKGSPLNVTAPMTTGPAEVRYMSGQGAKVLGRRPIVIAAAQIALNIPREAAANAAVTCEWTGPNHTGDYLTLVPKSAQDGTSNRNALTARGTPAKFTAPAEPGVYEIRYMSGQGNRVLARAEFDVR
jgi:hypothetical protein